MNAQEQAQFRWNHVAKPLNSLGKLEQLVVQIAGIQQTADVCINKRCALICCGDHGVVAEGVSQSGSEVTALVAQSIVAGTANINLMASVSGTDVYALDFGMVTPVMGTIDCRIAAGTRNMAREPAMTRAQAEQAVQAGIDAVARMKARGYQLIATGEMGIGNTTASTAMACALMRADGGHAPVEVHALFAGGHHWARRGFIGRGLAAQKGCHPARPEHPSPECR